VEGRSDRDHILQTIAEESPLSAAAIDELFSSSLQNIAAFPRMGKPGMIDGTREFIVHENYRIVYQVESDSITVSAITHTSRQWRPVLASLS
jgi:addiction module RelE/StbE family toxin